MDTIPIEIFNIILENIDNIKNLVLVNKYCHKFSKSHILENYYIKWYSKESGKNLIVYDPKQLELFTNIKKAKILNPISYDINSNNLTSLDLNYFNASNNKLNLPNLKKLCIHRIENVHKIEYFHEGLEYLEIKELKEYYFPCLPNSLITFKMRKITDLNMPVLPAGLIELELTVGNEIQILIGKLLKQLFNLKKLKLRNLILDDENCLPESLEILDLGDKYSHKIFKLPTNLQELHIGIPQEEESHDLPNLRKLTIEYLPEKSWCTNFNFSKLEELCIKSGRLHFNLPPLKKIICHPNFYIPLGSNIDTCETIHNLNSSSLSKKWKIIRFDNGYAIESHNSIKERNEYNKYMDYARYSEDFGKNTLHSFYEYEELIDRDLKDKTLDSYYHYFGKINTKTKIMYRTYPSKTIGTTNTYDSLKNKLTNYANGFLIDILSNFCCFVTGFYIMELMHSSIVSETIDIYCYTGHIDAMKRYLQNKYHAEEIHDNYFFVKCLNHLIKIRDSNEQRLFSFENVIIRMTSNGLKIYNNIPVNYNFLTTNMCYIKEHINSEKVDNKYHFLATLSILYKNNVNILFTNGIIKLLSGIFTNYSYPEYNFSYCDIYNKYHKNSEFINILKTELLLNYL